MKIAKLSESTQSFTKGALVLAAAQAELHLMLASALDQATGLVESISEVVPKLEGPGDISDNAKARMFDRVRELLYPESGNG